MFLSSTKHALNEQDTATTEDARVLAWTLPTFRGRVLYALRASMAILLCSIWMLIPATHSLFIPGFLIPVGVVHEPV